MRNISNIVYLIQKCLIWPIVIVIDMMNELQSKPRCQKHPDEGERVSTTIIFGPKKKTIYKQIKLWTTNDFG